MEKLLDDLLNKIIMRSWNLVIILFVACLLHSCDNCNNTELTSETIEWMQYYQNKEFSIFSNANSEDSLFISDVTPEGGFEMCSLRDCSCEVIRFKLIADEVDLYIEAIENTVLYITFASLPNGGATAVQFDTEKRKQKSISYYDLEIIQFEFQNQLYESIEIVCDQCNEVYIKRMVISKELGILEYEDELGNVWVKQ